MSSLGGNGLFEGLDKSFAQVGWVPRKMFLAKDRAELEGYRIYGSCPHPSHDRRGSRSCDSNGQEAGH